MSVMVIFVAAAIFSIKQLERRKLVVKWHELICIIYDQQSGDI